MSRHTMLRSAFVRQTHPPPLQSALRVRAQSTYAKAQLKCDDDSRQAGEATDTSSSVSPTASSRWFSELQARIRRLEDDGGAAKSSRVAQEAGRLLRQTNANWMGLLAGTQGFLTEPRWRGLDNHQVFWGDMDSMVSHAAQQQTGHINNVMYNRYAESARVQFIRHHGLDATAEERKQWEDLVTPRSLGLILKTMTTEFKF
ncbi:hypothetical protein CTA2_9234, partial [Colletotrichum tanaceti]